MLQSVHAIPACCSQHSERALRPETLTKLFEQSLNKVYGKNAARVSSFNASRGPTFNKRDNVQTKGVIETCAREVAKRRSGE